MIGTSGEKMLSSGRTQDFQGGHVADYSAPMHISSYWSSSLHITSHPISRCQGDYPLPLTLILFTRTSFLEGVVVDKQLACIKEKERVEGALFRGLSWQQATGELAPSGFPPPAWCNLSSLADIEWASGAETHEEMHRFDVRHKSSFKAKMQVWLNDIEKARFSHEVEHAFIGWIQALGQRTGKMEWRVALVGDSTLRGVASAWIRMLAGPQQWLNAFDRYMLAVNFIKACICR